MPEFDAITIVQDGKTLATLEPNRGEHEEVLGGGLVLRGADGKAVATIGATEGDHGQGSVAGGARQSHGVRAAPSR